MDSEKLTLILTATALVMVSAYACLLQIKYNELARILRPLILPLPVSEPQRTQQSESGCVMLLILFLLIIFGIGLLLGVFSG